VTKLLLFASAILVCILLAGEQAPLTTYAGTPAILAGYCSVGAIAHTQSDFFLLGDTNGSACFNADSPTIGLPLPSAGILKNLTMVARIQDSGNTPAMVHVDITVNVNSVPTALTCAVDTLGSPLGTKASCSDTLHRVSVHAGDQVTVQMSTPVLPPPCPVSCPIFEMNVTLEKR